MNLVLFKPRVRPEPSIRLTPLIDILFQLIIFFTVSSQLRWSPAIRIDLPAAATAAPVDRPMRLVISVDAAGRVWLDGTELEPGQLRRAFEERVSARQQPLLELEADRAAPYGVVLGVIDDARAAGIDAIAAFTTPLPAEPAAGR